ncbi:MAG: tetratricopeptide repeat protein [Bacteroidales bacterium]|jgi:hypothetical protein|nr:tetratricopeptide repeat protein [Bacteroidales bacterium]
MRKIVIIVLLAANTLLHGQQLSFRQVDTATYNRYLNQDWKELVEIGKTALDQGINYYYLQMRMAYSYFSLGKYRQAINYYNNALKFNSFDPVATEYLYYSYKYSGRESDALFKVSELTKTQKSGMGINDSSKLISLGLSHSYGTSNTDLIQDDILTGTTVLDGVQKATLNLHSTRLSAAHKLNNSIILDHNVTYITKDEISYVISEGTEYASPDQSISQWEYNLNMGITLFEGLLIKPGLHFVNTTIPIAVTSTFGSGQGWNTTTEDEIHIRKFIPSIFIEKKMTFLDAGISYVHHSFNEINTHQIGIHSTVYPLANLNLYITLDAYARSLSSGGSSKTDFILKPLLGFKLHKNYWMEVSATLPEHLNFYDIKNNIPYNSIEMSASTLEINGIIPLYKPGIKLFIGYKYRTMNSYYFPDDRMFEPLNKQQYSNHIITGGIKWTM